MIFQIGNKLQYKHGLSKDKAYLAYLAHKLHAKERGNDFLFSFDDWVAWWKKNLGSDWLKKRGPYKGQYVMARNGDKGPYVEWNVECKQSQENIKERVPNPNFGEANYAAKL